MLNKWCKGFLAHSKGRVWLDVNETSIVQGFPYVFPKMFLGLAFERDILEFSIKLVLGTTSISKAPYRIALVKL